MIQVKGTQFSDGKSVFPLRGFALGTWMMLENVMLGYPGLEQHFRGDLLKYAGKEKADFFFENFLLDFISEKDIAYIAKMGANVVRLPFNCRYFESDLAPYQYREEGFVHLDRVLSYCKKYGIYAILDLHSAPGFQNGDWHCDNPTGEIRLFAEPHYQERTAALWRYIADHYKFEDAVAAYEILNEPVALGDMAIAGLNKVYRDCVASIREVDKAHVIFLEGNLWGRSFEELEEPFDDNLAYACHFYGADPAHQLRYPNADNVVMNKSLLAQQIDSRGAFAAHHNRPLWIGEFASVTRGDEAFLECEKQYLSDQLDILNERGHSWTFWSYKTVAGWGTLHCAQDSAWMNSIHEIQELTKKYNGFFDGGMNSGLDLHNLLKPHYFEDFKQSQVNVDGLIQERLSAIFSRGLIDVYCQSLAKLSKDELKQITESFRFENCCFYENWLEPIRAHLR